MSDSNRISYTLKQIVIFLWQILADGDKEYQDRFEQSFSGGGKTNQCLIESRLEEFAYKFWL